MKTTVILFVIGIASLIGGIWLAYEGSKPLTSLSDRGQYMVDALIVIGFVLIGIASIRKIQQEG